MAGSLCVGEGRIADSGGGIAGNPWREGDVGRDAGGDVGACKEDAEYVARFRDRTRVEGRRGLSTEVASFLDSESVTESAVVAKGKAWGASIAGPSRSDCVIKAIR